MIKQGFVTWGKFNINYSLDYLNKRTADIYNMMYAWLHAQTVIKMIQTVSPSRQELHCRIVGAGLLQIELLYEDNCISR